MGSFDTLLDLQQLDTAIAQLQYRRSHLPEQERLNDLQRQLSALATAVAPTLKLQTDLDTRQESLEKQIHDIDVKIDSANKQLYGGTVTSSRELQALEADIASLKKHRSELEDVELELLVEREPADAAVAKGNAQRDQLDADGAQCLVAIAEALVSIDREAAESAARRLEVAETISPALLETYERIRKKNNGVGAARLDHGTCMSCRLKLSAVHLDALRKLAEIETAHCDECGVILVR